MTTILLRLVILLIFIARCNSPEIDKEPKIQDLTLYRDSITKYQKEYNEHALLDYKKLLAKLRLQPLSDLPLDSNGFRFTKQFGWGSVWSGSPLSLAIFSNGKKSNVETSEIVRWKDHFLNLVDTPFLSKNLYVSDTGAFNQLNKVIDKSDFWNRYSFNKNEGWVQLDGSQYYIEVKIDSSYKLIMEEVSDSVSFYYLYHFLNATDYNDTIKRGLEIYFDHKYTKSKD